MRQFLAVELPEAVRAQLSRLRRGPAAGAEGWRWTAREGLHLTLRFLGEVADLLDGQARGAWARAAGEVAPFRFRLGAVGTFSDRGKPRVLWVGVKDDPPGSLSAAAAAVERAARLCGFPPESREFQPHVTLARAPRGVRAAMPPLMALDDGPRISVDELVLFRSDLEPSGARYTALERFPLGERKGDRN